MELRLSLSTLLALCLTASAAHAADWEIDGKHSSANFKIRHMMISDVRGQIGGIKGTVNFDGKNVDDIKVTAQLDPATINTGDANRDAHLKNADFFDVTKFPSMTFESTGVVPVLRGGFKLGGKLTMHGVTRPVELTVDGPTESIKDSKGVTRVGAAATTTIKRKDWGLTYNSTLDNGGVALGEDVQVTIEVELVKKETPAGSATETPASPSTDKKADKPVKEKKVKEKKEKPVKAKKEKQVKTKTDKDSKDNATDSKSGTSSK
ncbi:MAG: YceI family protein [Candidatus Obscuribacterales bacterium]|nr:YceI family protein [Candidatus Obscuribacterales bacterium]